MRLHAPEYNPFSFENYLIMKQLLIDGHEVGYHSEIIDQSKIWGEDAAKCLDRDINVLSSMLDTKIVSVASHGGRTAWNNLDFWRNKKASDFDCYMKPMRKVKTLIFGRRLST